MTDSCTRRRPPRSVNEKKMRTEKALLPGAGLAAALLAFSVSCTPKQSAPDRSVPLAEPGAEPDILLTSLDFDVGAKTGVAIIEFAELEAGAVPAITLEKGDLHIQSVADPSGPLQFKTRGTQLDIGIPPGTRQLRVDYRYNVRYGNGGAISSGSTRIWPSHCGNLFPCNPSTKDGAKYRLAISGLTPDQNAVFPQIIPEDAPPYMVAWAVGDYQYTKLGETEAGTEVGTYSTSSTRYPIRSGTYMLVNAFNFFEKKLGPYAFGKKVGPVAVDWGTRTNAGIEYHPFWHVSKGALSNQMVHIHEAAHGWYGNAVRIACWEDYILSEGVTSYMTARAFQAVGSQWAAERLWRDYRKMLAPGNVWPTGCNENDVEVFGTASLHARGAFFFRAIEEVAGREALDTALSTFYVKYRGKAARFEDLLAHIKEQTKKDFSKCAKAWLRDDSISTLNFSSLCRS